MGSGATEGEAYGGRRRRRLSDHAAAWAEWVGAIRAWDLTATLTFDPKRRPEPPPGPQRPSSARKLHWPLRLSEDGRSPRGPLARDVAEAIARHWLRQNERANAEPIAAIVALEYHKNGWPHFHALLGGNALGGELAQTYLKTTWEELAGFCRIEAPRSVADCAAYAAKYLVKDLDRGTVLLWPPSGRLDRPSWPRQGRVIVRADA